MPLRHPRTLSIPIMHGSFDYADSTDYYFGASTKTPYTTDLRNYVVIPRTGRIRQVYLHYYNGGGTASSNENMSYYLHTATSDTLIGTVGDVNTFKDFNKDDLNILVTKGDKVSIKITTPAWGTNPTQACVVGELVLSYP